MTACNATGGAMSLPAPIFESFLVLDGRVTAFDLHVARFTAAVTDAFGANVAAQIPAVVAELRAGCGAGARFPKLVATPDGVHWQDRPAPTRTATLTVAPHPVTDTRMHPQFKGPELAWLQEQMAAAGGDVVLIRDGVVAETATAAILIADGANSGAGTRILTPNAPALASTTLAWFAATIAKPERAAITWDELAAAAAEGRAVALNALHGPRTLQIRGIEPPALLARAAQQRADAWRERWYADGQPCT